MALLGAVMGVRARPPKKLCSADNTADRLGCESPIIVYKYILFRQSRMWAPAAAEGGSWVCGARPSSLFDAPGRDIEPARSAACDLPRPDAF